MYTVSFNRSIYFGFLLAALFLLWGLGSVPLTDVDEGAFSEATREMLARGDFISPWLLDSPRFDKPVLIHWLQMLFVSLFGINEFAVRLPSALAGLAWIMICTAWTIDISRRYISHESKAFDRGSVIDPLLTIAIMTTCLGLPIISRASTADALLNALICASLYAVWLATQEREVNRQAKRYIRIAAILIALGLLTKGPIALLIPVACSFLVAVMARQLRLWTQLAFDLKAWLLLLVITMPWYILQFRAQGMAFIEGFLGLHNVGRFTSTMHGFHGNPAYYLMSTTVVILPWLPRLIASLYALVRGQHLANRVELLLLWVNPLLVILFFSFSATKLPHYGFYGLTGIFLLMAVQPAFRFRFDLVFTSILLALFASMPLWLDSILSSIHDPYFYAVAQHAFEQLVTNQSWLFYASALCAVLGLVVSALAQPIWHKWGQILAAGLLAIFLHHGLTPTLVHANRDPIKKAGLMLKNMTTPTKAWRLTAPSLSFYAQKVIPNNQEPLSGDHVVLYSHLKPQLAESLSQRHLHVKLDTLMDEQGISLIKITTK